LEKPVDDKRHGAWISAAVDVLMNGRPSDKYEKYWKTEAVDGFPLNASNRDESIQALNAVNFKPESEEYSLDEMYVRLDSFFDTYECSLPMEQQRMNMDDICKNKVLREDVAYSPCWKKIAICVLKNDVSFKFCGFGATLRERQAREEAIAAFDTKQSEKESAKAEALRLAEQIKREKEA
jgi:predicted phosphoadenosine phosphosulfate sulfurtransferase